MTKIYTNVPSMIARTNLTSNMALLQTSLERLSTGLRINSGKDDPAGLIASEILRSDITGIKTAIKNTERANMMIATADSALNEVTSLLNDIRGLVTEAANTGAMSAEMIAANQLQVDASLDAIDRIASQTTFMGQKLLDGSLDFDKTGVDRNTIQNLAVHQVTFGSDKAPIDVSITVQEAAKKAELYYNNPVVAEDLVLQWGGNQGYTTESFQRGATVQDVARAVNASSSSTGVVAEVGSDALPGTIYTSSLGTDNDIIITAGQTGTAAGNLEIKYLKGNSKGVVVNYEEPVEEGGPGKLLVYLQTEEYKSAVASKVDPTPGVNDNNALTFTANIEGAQYNNASINYVDARFTDANWGNDLTNPYGVAEAPYAYYNDEGTRAKALFGDVNGFNNLTNFSNGEYFSIESKATGSNYNNTAITFINDTAGEVPSGKGALARYDATTNQLRIYFKDGASVEQVKEALAIEGTFDLKTSADSVLKNTLDSGDGYDAENNPFDPASPDVVPMGYSNTSNSGGDPGTLFIAIPPDGKFPTGHPKADEDITANDIVEMFDINSEMSRGSERAAKLFSAEREVDNDGTGLVKLYNYENDEGDEVVVKTQFKNIFKDGVTGGDVVTTAAELVTALNNSAYWGMTMCPEMLAELADYNKSGTYFDSTDPPLLTAKLAPGNHGLFPVSAFEEVAYYGDPNEGTGIQFLGEKNSPNIRFVAEPGNDHIWIDRTTVPDVEDFATSVLTATNPNASLVITANKKGGDYDDVQFVFKRISEDEQNSPFDADDPADPMDPNRKNGWVDYDPGTSFAEAQATFKTSDDYDIANTAFYIKATDRGDMYNDVKIVMTKSDTQTDRVNVVYDEATKQLRVSLSSAYIEPSDADPSDTTYYEQINANEVIAAINKSDSGFKAELSYAQDMASMYDLSKPNSTPPPAYESYDPPYPSAYNDGTGTFENFGLKVNQLTEVANTEDSGGHLGGTVTVWITDVELDPTDPTTNTRPMNATEVANLINSDQVVGKLFNVKTYSTGPDAGTGSLDLVKDGPIVTSGGIIEKGAITVHLATDKNGLVTTTARDLVEWWQQQDPATVDNISASIVRPPGAVWDECNDPYGNGLLAPTVSLGDCDELIVNDIQFVGWNDDGNSQTYVAAKAKGTMTSDNGENSSYDLIARRTGPDYNGYTIQYINDTSVTGSFKDNLVDGSSDNPCDNDPYTGLEKNDCGEPIAPTSSSNKGMYLEFDPNTKTISIHVQEGVTTAYDIEQLIESDPYTRNIFEIQQKGDGSGLISLQDDTLLTEGGALPPGDLNGAKLLFGSEASEHYLIFKSAEYGSDQFVDVRASGKNGGTTTFKVYTDTGKAAEKIYGQDVSALVNGVKAVGAGLNASLNTSTLAMDFTLSEDAGTDTNYSTNFTIDGGGATYQIGPDVVSNQQITLGIQSVNTVQLGGASGKLYQLRSGQDASLTTDTNKAFRIVEESILAITQIRGRLGTMQKATFDTNINVLNDTLESLVEAESQIRDTDFAEETAALTRAQILVQSSISALGIANQLPNYMLSLLGR